MNYIILDTETGGLNPDKHSLLTVGLVFVKDDKIVNEVEFKIKHDEYIVQARAMEVNKINLSDLDKYGKPIDEVKKLIINLIKDEFGDSKPQIIGQNVHFDVNFIHKQLIPKNELDNICSYRLIDTAGIAGLLHNVGILPSASLSDVVEYYGCGRDDDPERHTAVYDARITWYAYKNMRDTIKGLIK